MENSNARSESETIPSEWIQAARQGSTEAVGRILEACRHDLVRLAETRIDDDLRVKGAASDIVQETFLEASRDLGSFQGSTDAEWRAWLRTILWHNLKNFSRQFRKNRKRDVNREFAFDAEDFEGLALRTPSPSSKAAAAEEAAQLQTAIDSLPEDYRQVVLLREREQKSFAEIAEMLNRSEEAARKLWFRAVQQLRNILGSPQ